MKKRQFSNSKYNFLNIKQKIKYKLLPKKNYLLNTKNLSFLKNYNFESKSINKSYIESLTPTIFKKGKSNSKRNIKTLLFKTNNNNKINKKIINSFDCKYNNIYKNVNIRSKNNNKNKNELKEQFEKTQFRLFCKMIGNNYNAINNNDIDCILQCPHRGVEKIKLIHKSSQISQIKRTISGYNIKNDSTYQIINPLKTISKKSGLSSTLLRKVIDYSLNHKIKNVYKIINEKIENKQILNNKNNIFLNIPLKSSNTKKKYCLLSRTKSSNYNKLKEDSIFFDTFIPEDFRITSKIGCAQKSNNDNNIN